MIRVDLVNPLVMIHAGGLAHGRENSIEAVRKSIKYRPDIIELDVRKSRDGVLYCYHGFPWFPFFFIARFFKYLNFSTIRHFVHVDTLQEVFGVITKPLKVFLDLKQDNINSEDIESVCSKFDQEVWLAGFALMQLSTLRQELGDSYGYVYNFSFLNFKKGLQKAQEAKIDAFKLLPWQCTSNNIQQMQAAGILHVIHPFLISIKHYRQLVQQYGSLWVCVDDMRKPNEWLRQI